MNTKMNYFNNIYELFSMLLNGCASFPEHTMYSFVTNGKIPHSDPKERVAARVYYRSVTVGNIEPNLRYEEFRTGWFPLLSTIIPPLNAVINSDEKSIKYFVNVFPGGTDEKPLDDPKLLVTLYVRPPAKSVTLDELARNCQTGPPSYSSASTSKPLPEYDSEGAVESIEQQLNEMKDKLFKTWDEHMDLFDIMSEFILHMKKEHDAMPSEKPVALERSTVGMVARNIETVMANVHDERALWSYVAGIFNMGKQEAERACLNNNVNPNKVIIVGPRPGED